MASSAAKLQSSTSSASITGSTVSKDETKPLESKDVRPLAKYRLLGTSGLRVSALCLGTMNFGLAKGWEWAGSTTRDEAFAIFDAFVAAGGNFIDTADVYHNGLSEIWLGEWMKTRDNRHKLVIATKFSNVTGDGINDAGNHRKHMMHALSQSLKRLQTDYIDLYYVHFWDFTTPVDEVLRNLQDLVSQGKVHHLGASDMPAWMVAKANAIAGVRGWHPFVAYQGKHSLIDRDIERDIIPMAKDSKMGIVPWGAVGQGVLTGKYKKGEKPEDAPRSTLGRPVSDRAYEIADVVAAIAKELDASPAQVALAWCLQDTTVSCLIGVRTLVHLKDNLGATRIKFSESQLSRLNEVSKIDLGFPHTMIGTSYKTNVWIARVGQIE